MDFLEKAFGRYWKTPRQKEAEKPTTIQIQEVKKYLSTIVDFLIESKNSFEISGSLYSVGFYNETLLLPDQIGLFADRKKNHLAYLYLTLTSCAIYKLDLRREKPTSSKVEDRLFTLKHSSRINHWLDEKLPGFKDLQDHYLNLLLENTQNSVDFEFNRFIFLNLKNRDFNLEDSFELIWENYRKATKRNDLLSEFLHCSLPLLNTVNVLKSEEVSPTKQSKSNNEITTEKKRKRSEAVTTASFDEKKEELNPITHSFEKMETADDYEGGRKFDSGDDDLKDHQAALDEVELSQVTISGETSKSLYRQDSDLIISRENSEQEMVHVENQSYPEWNAKKQNYLKNYCQVYVSKFNHKNFDIRNKDLKNEFRQSLLEKYKKDFLRYKGKIDQLYNEPLWLKRLKEGSEIDMDALIRTCVDIQSGHSGSDRIYSSKKKQQKDIAVLFLFDQSLSSDSWLGDQRILDIILECVGLSGLIFENLISQTLVAGASSATRHHIDFFIYKDFKKSWDCFFQSIKEIKAQGYTRFGPAIRHATTLLDQTTARKKIMILLTDGKPTDLDKYEGLHGINDIHKAVLEAEQKGFFVSALTIDQESKAQFVKMFPRFSILSKPKNLFEELFKILTKSLQ